MKDERNLIYKISLSLIKGVGDITAKKLVSHCGSAELVFKESKKALMAIPGVSNKTVSSICSEVVLKRAEKEI